MRRIAQRSSLVGCNIQITEDIAWNLLIAAVKRNNNCIVESTGTIYRLTDLWTPKLVNRGIYTIKFTAPVAICQKRARQRVQKPIKGYDLDESYEILLDKELQYILPANLIVDTSDLSNKEEKFKEIEKYILKAEKSFEIYKTIEIFGKNQLKKEK